MSHYDSIVIGAGHNGLVCATLLARAGQRVLVLEANDGPGGLAADREFYPGFHAPLASTLYALPEDVLTDLRLDSYGFQLPSATLSLLALAPGEAPVTIGPEYLSGAGDADAEAYPRYLQQLQTFQQALAPFWSRTMPRIGDTDTQALLTFAQLGLKLRLMGRDDMLEFFRVATLPMRDLVDEHFENPALKAALCWDGLVGSRMAPRSPNQAVLTLLNRMAGAQGGRHGIPAGGMGGFIAALVGAANAAGVDIRTSTAVERVTLEGSEDGLRCTGVELAGGEVVHGGRVISSADPKTTFLRLVGAANLEIEFSNRIRRLRSDGYVARLNLALSGEPEFTGVARADGRMILASSMDQIEFAWDAAKYGDCPEQPVMELVLPSMHDGELAPGGQHVLCANVMYVPAELRGGWNPDRRQAFIDTLLSELTRYAPGIRELLIHSELLTPADIQRQYHVSGGHWHHGEPAIDQLLMMRPTYEAAQYRTPIDGLYLCGAGCHPGGDITGNPGRNAAREIMA